jgi:hypothetical protein
MILFNKVHILIMLFFNSVTAFIMNNTLLLNPSSLLLNGLIRIPSLKIEQLILTLSNLLSGEMFFHNWLPKVRLYFKQSHQKNKATKHAAEWMLTILH